MADAGRIEVEVAYALPDQQTVIAVSVAADACVADAIAASGIVERHPEIGTAPSVGIFGRSVTLAARPRAGDRIEIYRPLAADPKQLRRARVRKKNI